MALITLLRQETTRTCTDGCLTGVKIGFAISLLVEGLLFGHIIFLLKRSPRYFDTILGLGNSTAAGIFFAAGLLHVLPEAVELLSSEDEEHHEEEEEDPDHEDEGVLREEEEDSHSDHGGFAWAFFIVMISFYALFFIEKILLPKILGSKEIKSVDHHSDLENASNDINVSIQRDDRPKLRMKEFKSKEFASGFVEILGLSAHSIFESMALGLSKDFDTVLNIFIATTAHRWATSAALSFKLTKSLSYWPFFSLLIVFSTMVPIGIGIGAALSSLSDSAQGVLFAISAGTFIYIGVFENMTHEFVENTAWPGRKFIACLVGAGIIVVITVLLDVFDIHG